LWQFFAKNYIAFVGSSGNGYATIGISQLAWLDVPRDFARYATVWEVEAKS
jgi:hypothetical protein